MLTFWAVLVFLINGVPVYAVQVPTTGDSFETCQPFATEFAEKTLEKLRKSRLAYVEVDAFCRKRGTIL